MKRTTRILVYTVMGAAVLIAGFFVIRSGQLQEELSESREQLAMERDQLELLEELNRIDGLLLNGDYSRALQAYSGLIDEYETSEEINFRMEITKKLISLSSRTSKPDSVINDTQDTSTAIKPASAEEIRAYDSLRFVVEKNKVQLELLKRQLREKASGTYLTLTSTKGNTMHYVGEVRNGKANGRGIALLTTGSRYVGQWKDNMRHGRGTFYWPDGEYYEGEYLNDKRSGQGTYFWPSGERFVGQWKDDERNGQGTFYGPEGEVVAQGTWKDDELVEMDK